MTEPTMSSQPTDQRESNAVVEVAVVNLFGKFSYTLPLGGERRCLVIYGANGVGKTTVLRMLHALFAGDLRVFAEYPFGEFMVTLADRSALGIAPFWGGRLQVVLSQQDSPGNSALVDISQKAQSYQDLHRPYGGLFDAPDHLALEVDERTYNRGLPDWLQRVRMSTCVRLIETDRATRTRDSMDAVQWCAADLGRRLEKAATRYASQAQALDFTLPTRFVQGDYRLVSAADLPALLHAVREGFDRMQRIGLLPDTDTPALSGFPAHLEEHQVRFLSLYAQDAGKKLAVITDFAERVELFIRHVQDWLDDKIITVTPAEGFVIEDKATRTRIPYTGLSSGERHLLVMWYELLFCTQPGALVLIDEPEISWHVSWQKRFLDDLLRVSELVGFSTLIASHSPFIPGDHLDLTFPLGREE